MAASGFTPISLYYSTTASAVPTSGNLANGELGLNIADMKLYAKNSAGTVTLLASNAGASGSVTSVSGTGTVNGLTLTGTVTTSGSLTLGGTLSLVSPPPIGSTTPNTGAFTTLSSTTATVDINSASQSSGITLQNSNTGGYGTQFNSALYGYAGSPAAMFNVLSMRTFYSGTSGYVDFYTKVQPQSTEVLALSLQGNGNVGIGTSSPAYPFDVTKAGGGNFVAYFKNTTNTTPYTVRVQEAASAANGYPLFDVVNSAGTNAYFLVHSGTGNVGIGTSSPNTKLQVSAAAPTIRIQESTTGGDKRLDLGVTSGGQAFIGANQSAQSLQIQTLGSTRFEIGPSGQFGIGGATYGNAGEVLTSGGSGAAPTWAAAGGGSQAFVAFGSTGGF
jgi:hypothetical protein